jgi:hypothetical protein
MKGEKEEERDKTLQNWDMIGKKEPLGRNAWDAHSTTGSLGFCWQSWRKEQFGVKREFVS